MKYSKFEQQLANTLRQDEVSLDINALIEGIHGKKKKDKKWLLILFFAIGIVGLAGAVMYFGQRQDINVAIAQNNINTSSGKQSDLSAITKQKVIQNMSSSSSSSSSSSNVNSPSIVTNSANRQSTSSQNSAQKAFFNNNVQVLNRSSKNTTNSTVPFTSLGTNDEYAISPTLESQKNETIIIWPLTSGTQSLVYNRPQIKTDKVECPTFSNRHKWSFELIPEIGYFRPLKTFENTSGEENNIFNLRKEKEKTLEGLQAALYIQLRKQKSPFYLRTGLSYARLTEKMQLDYSYTKLDTTRGIISVTVSQTGDTVTTIVGNIITESRLSGKKVAHHSFSLYDIPVAVGYEKKMGQWSLGIEGGVMLNLSMSSAGSTLVSDTSFLAVDMPGNQFRTNIGLSYFGGLTIGRDFHRLGRFYLAARARFIPTSFTTDQNRFRQSYHFVGLHLGYVYTF